MIIDSIELNRVGGFRRRVVVGPFDPGLNILSAPNEKGKSTLVRSAARCLFDKHTTKAEEIKSLQPLGSDLAPEMVVEFRVAGERYKLEKRFLTDPSSLLSRWTNGAWEEVAEQDAADKRVFELLSSVPPGRGASKPEHWGLMQYLWARQGDLADWPEWDGDSGEMIRRRLAKVDIDPALEEVKETLRGEFLAEFTRTGQLKKGGELSGLQAQLETAEEDLVEVQDRRDELEQQENKYRQLSDEVIQLARLREDKAAEAKQLSAEQRKVEVLTAELASAEKDLAGAKALLESTDRARRNIETCVKEQGESRVRLDQNRKTLEQLVKDEEALTKDLGRATEQVASLDRERDAARKRLARLRLLHQRADLTERVEGARIRLKEIEEVEKALGANRERVARLPKLTEPHVVQCRDLEGEVRDLEVQLEASGLTIELTAEKDGRLGFENETGAEELELKKGESKRCQGRRSVKLDLPEWGSIVVRSGARELQELETDLQAKREALEAFTKKLGVSSSQEASRAFLDARELNTELKAQGRELNQLLGNVESREHFHENLTKLEAGLSKVADEVGELTREEEGVSGVALVNEVTEREVLFEELEKRIKQARRQVEKLQEGRSGLLTKRSEAKVLVAQDEETLVQSEKRRKEIEEGYPLGVDDAMEKAQAAFVETKAVVDVARKKLPEGADRLPARAARALRASTEAQQMHDTKSGDLKHLEGSLANAAASGLHSREAELAAEVEGLQVKIERRRRRGLAARLVVELMERRKASAVKRVLEPLERRLSATFAELTGDTSRSVFLDEDLVVLGVGRSREELIGYDSLSQGAKEQLLLSLRGAVAMELAEDEPQVLILDDVLVNTDPIRQARVLDFLGGLAEKVQIVVLTCHEDRYGGIGRRLTLGE